MSYENRGRDWSDASTSQEMTRIYSCHQKLGERHRTGPSSEPSEGASLSPGAKGDMEGVFPGGLRGAWPWHTLMLDF